MQQLIFNSRHSLPATLILCVISDFVIKKETAELLVILDRYNFQGQLIQRDLRFCISLIGTDTGRNYSLGDAMGSCLSDFGIQAKGVQSLDLYQLVGEQCIAFVHHRRSKNGQMIASLHDIYPLKVLQSIRFTGRVDTDASANGSASD